VDVVGEAVEQSPGQAFAAQDLGPLVEWQVAGHQGGAALVALARSSCMMMRFLVLTSNGGRG
jgi:hypothetical protein